MLRRFISLYKFLIAVTHRQLLLFTTAFLFHCTLFTSCEKKIDIKVKDNTPMLVVESYINNDMSDYNYVVLSKSLNYLSVDFESTPVSDAVVTITEGEKADDGYDWDTANKVRMEHLTLPGVPAEINNFYFDP